VPICGIPLAVAGVIFGILGIKSDQRTLAIIGMVLSALGLIGGIINAVLGAYLGLSGQIPMPFGY
jgi:disulfide bond formation protein DsbB